MTTVEELMNLEGRVALITGGGGHIGREIAACLLELGASVCLVDISKENITVAREALATNNLKNITELCIDLEAPEAISDIHNFISKEYGQLNILVNCAALVGTSDLTGWSSPFLNQSEETFTRALKINLTIPTFLIQQFAPMLSDATSASVINIASIYGMLGPDMSLYKDTDMGSPAAYAASKGGLIQMTRWLATVLAPAIRVNAVSLGGIERNQATIFQERYRTKTPLSRMGVEDDIKGVIAYLASDLSSYVTGQNLVVDGGWSIW